jgi:hypothetical protein
MILKISGTLRVNAYPDGERGMSGWRRSRWRKRPDYRKAAAYIESTHPAIVSIGERRRPDPQGRPEYLRSDAVHQGDWEGEKGVYHINSVDAVTQWEM